MSEFCSGCLFEGRTRVPFTGPIDASLALVGEAPGYMEVRQKEPFIGPSGQLLTRILKFLHLPRQQFRIGNALLCGQITEVDRKHPAFRDALARCARRREAEGDLGGIRTVLALGAVAAEGLLGEPVTLGGRVPRRGALHRDTVGRAVFPTWHPAALIRAGGAAKDRKGGLSEAEAEILGLDIEKAWQYARGERKQFDPFLYTTGDPKPFTVACRRMLAGDSLIAIDVEATSIDPLTAKLTVIGLAYYPRPGAQSISAISFWWPNRDAAALEAFRALLAGPQRKVMQNGFGYDVLALERLVGPVAGPFDDTLLAMHAAFPDVRLDLGSIAHTFLVVPPWKSNYRRIERAHETGRKKAISARARIERNNAKRIVHGKDPFPLPAVPSLWEPDHVRELLYYNGMDVATTLAVIGPIREECRKRRVEKVADLDVDLAGHARTMVARGLFFDREVRATLHADLASREEKASAVLLERVLAGLRSACERREYGEEIHELLEAIKKNANKSMPRARIRRVKGTKKADGIFECILPPPDPKVWTNRAWNPGSPKQLAAALDICEVPVPAKAVTKTGQRSLSKTVLAEVADHPVVAPLIAIRKYRNLLAHYFESGDLLLDAGGRLHVAQKVHGTPTGRWSTGAGRIRESGSIGIAVQNWPSAMRAMIVAPDGYFLVGCDFAQLELRAIALLAAEDRLLDVFNDASGSRDMHSENAARLYGKDWAALDPADAVDEADLVRRKTQRKMLRWLTKTGLYASMYGAIARTVQAQLRAKSLHETDPVLARVLREISEDTCQRFVDAIPMLWPQVARWRVAIGQRIQRDGYYVCPLSGRRRTWPLGMVDHTQAVNNPVQMFAGSIMNGQFLKMQAVKPADVHPIIQVHDSIAYECPQAIASEFKVLLEQTMTTVVNLRGRRCLFPVEAAVGRSLKEV